MLHVPSNLRIRTERGLSAVAFIVVLASWILAYTVVCPPDTVQHHVRVAQVRR